MVYMGYVLLLNFFVLLLLSPQINIVSILGLQFYYCLYGHYNKYYPPTQHLVLYRFLPGIFICSVKKFYF